jgi:hypothetical protein
MRFWLLPLFFPLFTFSQDLPDSSLAKQLHIKKLIILKCTDGMPCDTENVYVLDGIWKNKNGVPLNDSYVISDTSWQKVARDEKGRIIFYGPKNKPKYCPVDSALSHSFRYDNKNRLIEESVFSCDKGVHRYCYAYTPNGLLKSKSCQSCVIDFVSREDYYYTPTGQLDSVVSWMAIHPEQNERDSSDSKVATIKYIYDKNGLITEAITYDSSRAIYSITDWKGPDEPIEYPAHLRFRYIYIY